jgi:SAM-dependent methyltransferase
MTAEPSVLREGGGVPVAVPREDRLLEPADAAIFETFVVPRYVALFGDLAIEMMVESEDAQVVHLHCRTGYPDRGIASKLPGAYVVGVDASGAALSLARAKAAAVPDLVCEYHQTEDYPVELPESAFSHALTLQSVPDADERAALLAESARLLAVHGQFVMAMPMGGSFQELYDLLREYSLKHDDFAVAHAVDRAALARPTVESLGAEVMAAGFDFVEDALRPTVLRFRSGRDFFEDPVSRLAILPEIRADLDPESAEAAFAYVRDAIDKYWSDAAFELTVNVGCVTGRRE